MNEAVGSSTDAPAALPAVGLIPARLDEVLRARLGTSRKAPSASALAHELRALAPATFGDARWFAAIYESMARLRRADARDGGPNGRGARSRKPSVAAAKKPLGLRAVTPWRQIYDQILPGLGLGIAATDSRTHARLGGDHRAWAAAVVARARHLWRKGSPPPWSATCDALVWSQLDLPGKPKETPPEIQAHFLVRIIGRTAQRSPARLLGLLAARQVEAVRPDLRSLKEALTRRWLSGRDTWTEIPPAAPAIESPGTTSGADSVAPTPLASGRTESPPQVEPVASALDLQALAALVRQSASTATEGVFGRRKVFISRLWQQLRTHPALTAMPLDAFKRQLIAAHKAGLLVLARADLVAAMDPRDVAESETTHVEARYHFVERESEP